MVLTAEQDLILWEVATYFFSLSLMGVALRTLVEIARDEMRPRATYMKEDTLFTSYAKGQNWSWDWCLVFGVRRDDAETSEDPELQAFTLRRVVERLEGAKLETKMFRSFDRTKIFLKIRATSTRLKDEAGRIKYKLLLNPGEVSKRIRRGYKEDHSRYLWYPRRQGWTVPEHPDKVQNTAIVDVMHQSPYEYTKYIYGTYVRREELQSAYEKYYPSNSIFRGVDRLILIKSIIETDSKNQGASINLDLVLAKRAILAALPLHDLADLNSLQNCWLKYKLAPWKQPVTMIKDYFGERIGLYFLFIGYYTTWVCVSAGVGVMVTIIEFAYGPADVVVIPWFAFYTSLWATAFLESWKGTQAKFSMFWGMTDFETQEQTRPEFVGREINSPVTGFPILYFSQREKLRAYVTSYLVVLASLVGVLAVLSAAFVMQAFIANRPIATKVGHFFGRPQDGRSIGLLLSHVAIALVSWFGCDLFKGLAVKLNNLENHRTETEFEDNLIAKVFIFRFVISYAPLFYIAVAKNALSVAINSQRAGCFHENCFDDISRLLATIFIVRVFVGNTAGVIVPSVRQVRDRRRRRLAQSSRSDAVEYLDPTDPDKSRKRQTTPTEEQFLLDEYPHLLGTFDDYAEIITQFGYVTLFAIAFPLGPLFAFVNNYIKIRFDGWKLCQNKRRAWPMGAEDIGTWQTVLSIMTLLATFTNSFLVTFTGTTFQDFTIFERLLLFTLFEYALLAIKVALEVIIADVPAPVDLQIKRMNFLTSKIIHNERDDENDFGDDDDDDNVDLVVVEYSDPDVLPPPKPDDHSMENDVAADAPGPTEGRRKAA